MNGVAPTNSSPDHSLHSQFVQYGQNAKEWLRKCALLLPEINRREIWRKKGFSSLYEYAAKLAGMSQWAVNDALRILKKAEGKPEIQKLIAERGVSAARPIITIATQETGSFWAQKAREMAKNTLETYVREYRKENGPRPNNAEKAPKREIAMELSPEIAAELEKLKGRGDWNELMKEFLELRKQKLEQEKPVAVPTEARHIPAKIKTFVIKKTRGQCAYPGCTKPYHILHHTQRWALEKTHDPDRLVPLCKAHERIAHHGLIAHEERSTEQWGILHAPEWWNFKTAVDQTVMEYRRPK